MRKTRIIALAMLAIALCFLAYALGHPEGFFPWSLTVTRWFYGLYLIVMSILFFA